MSNHICKCFFHLLFCLLVFSGGNVPHGKAAVKPKIVFPTYQALIPALLPPWSCYSPLAFTAKHSCLQREHLCWGWEVKQFFDHFSSSFDNSNDIPFILFQLHLCAMPWRSLFSCSHLQALPGFKGAVPQRWLHFRLLLPCGMWWCLINIQNFEVPDVTYSCPCSLQTLCLMSTLWVI